MKPPKALGIAGDCNGKTEADYLEPILQDNALPSITRDEEPLFHVLHGKLLLFSV